MKMLDFKSGGWVLLLSTLLVATVVAWQVVPILTSGSRRPALGGDDVDAYGFDLSDCLVPRDLIAASGMPKDGLPALTGPPTMTPDEVDVLNREKRGKYLVSDDRIVGVALGGEARAYPIRVLNWHEVVNDVLGGRAIAVTYSPLCDSIVVFDRESGGETLEFGVSGLLYNSNLLMYDRRPAGDGESVWSQLPGRAISGPARGRLLDILPFSLVTWERWRALHLETTVLRPDPEMSKRYARNPYGSYYSRGRLRFPVRPLPPEGDGALMSRLVAVGSGEDRCVMPLEDNAGSFDVPGGTLTVGSSDPPTFLIETEATHLPVIHAFRFAWHAAAEEDKLPSRQR